MIGSNDSVLCRMLVKQLIILVAVVGIIVVDSNPGKVT